MRRHPSALSLVAPGRLVWTTWDSAHFPALIIPACSAGTGPCCSGLRHLPLRLCFPLFPSSPPFLTHPLLHHCPSPPLLPDLAFDSADDVCYVHMCDHTSTVSPSVPAGSGKAEFDEHKCLIKEPCAQGFPGWFTVLASYHLAC